MISKPLYPVPHRAGTLGMILFLVALGVLFASSMLGYFAIRIVHNSGAAGSAMHLPPLLWLSTVVIITSSVTMSRALAAIRNERLGALRSNLHYTLALAITFIAIQTPAMIRLLQMHRATPQTLYGLLFFLILLHAAHVLGGVVALVMVTRGARRRAYDHEHHAPVRNATWYWHFLDVVWLVMFLSMWIMR
jgi:heme/copper-type cytochrome/quinol oxidase subunit 3